MSSSNRLIIGTAVGFLTGTGFMGLSAVDANLLTNNIDSIIGGVIAAISLVGFIEHHLQAIHASKNTNSSSTVTVVGTAVAE